MLSQRVVVENEEMLWYISIAFTHGFFWQIKRISFEISARVILEYSNCLTIKRVVFFSKITAEMEMSGATSQSTMFPLVEFPSQGAPGNVFSMMSQTGFNFSGSRTVDWI